MTHRIGNTVLELSGADHTSAVEITRSVQRFHDDFPKAAKMLHVVRLSDMLDFDYYQRECTAARTGRTDGNPMGSYPVWPTTGYFVELNSTWYGKGRRELAERNALLAHAEGVHPFDQVSYVFDHELGHVLDMHSASKNYDFCTPYSWECLVPADGRSIGGYACDAPHEAFAEAFAMWWNGRPVGNQNVRDCINAVTSLAREERLVAA